MKLFFATIALSITISTPIFAADCAYYWTGSGYVWRCEPPTSTPIGSNCHWETNSSTGQTYWVCD